MFELMFGLFFVAFFCVLGIIVYSFVQQAKRERTNDRSPRLTVAAGVVGKRAHISRGHSADHNLHSHTTYFVTFEVESGDRMELRMTGQEYGLLVEGDYGDLTFQGSRYLGFVRKVKI